METRSVFILLLSFATAMLFRLSGVGAQTPFVRNNQTLAILENTNQLVEIVIHPTNNSVIIDILNGNIGVEIHALGFRKTDNLLYGIGLTDKRLYQIDATGAVFDIGIPALNANYFYLAGDVHPDGQHFYVIGSETGLDQHLFRIDLSDPDFSTSSIPFPGTTRIKDIAFDPYSLHLYAYDSNGRKVIRINPSNGNFTPLAEFQAGRELQTVYTNAFGELEGFGTSQFGVAGAILRINESSGIESVKTTGPVYHVADAASIPYSIDIYNRVSPASTFPCSQVKYIFTMGNGSGQTQSMLDFEFRLPAGFSLVDVEDNPFGGIFDAPGGPQLVRFDNMTLQHGVDSLIILAEIDDIAGGNYKTQAKVEGFPSLFGSTRYSDDPRTVRETDSTNLAVFRIEEDSLTFSHFLCLGQTLTLDASQYGNNIQWHDGSSANTLLVSGEGLYSLQATSGCQVLSVGYEVTAASCPFTIEITHTIWPRKTIPCSEVILQFIIENDSGLEREGVRFYDFVPDHFTVLGIERNPFGGHLVAGSDPNEIIIENMDLPIGIDTLEILAEVGDLPPGICRNRAMITSLPESLGPNRFSFDPSSFLNDSTEVEILGVEDSTIIREIICEGDTLVLDGSPYGFEFLWEDGSNSPFFTVTETGSYKLTFLGGCDPYFAIFNVEQAPVLDIQLNPQSYEIRLGESRILNAQITNFGDSLSLLWTDPTGQSLSCLDCPSPLATPIENTVFTLTASNGICTDVQEVEFRVDQRRRIFVPNVFTPNHDGVNDIFYLQSPDFGIIKSLTILDRWGSQVYQVSGIPINDPSTGWTGIHNGRRLDSGVYIWVAEIEFAGGISAIYSGDIALLK